MQIIKGAFTKTAAFGGFIGILVIGFKRAAFSNEAGIGSAPIAHSAARTNEPVSEGIIALLGPFLDSIIICTMTALVIIITGNAPVATTDLTSDAAIGLTSRSFESVMPWFPPVLSLVAFLFGLSTTLAWAYYGMKAWTYLFGKSKAKENIYKISYCILIVIGSAISAQSVFDFGDVSVFIMAFPNILGMYFLMRGVKVDMKDYFRRLASGEIKRYK